MDATKTEAFNQRSNPRSNPITTLEPPDKTIGEPKNEEESTPKEKVGTGTSSANEGKGAIGMDANGDTSQLHKVSTLRKIALLFMFVFAEFLDSFNNSALFPALPALTSDLGFKASEIVWVISAYLLTFASFLLMSGRVADVYTPKPPFIAGCFLLGLTHLGAGFVRQKIAMLVLRALGGIGGAFTIPSALSMIVQLFPEPSSQARAISLFGSAGAIGNIMGMLIGAVLVQYAGWQWVYFFVAIIGCSIGAVCFFLIPNVQRDRSKQVNFDATGVSILTIAAILFIFAVTSGATAGWGTAYVLCPLLISLAILGVFLWWEAHLPTEDAVLPPRAWRYTNLAVIVGLSLSIYFWWATLFALIIPWYQEVYGWSVISSAVHFLPTGIAGWITSFFTGHFPKYLPHKYIIFIGLSITIVATILLPFADAPTTYWRFAFPSFLIGSVGMMIVFAGSSIAIFHYTPPSVAGTVGAVFTCALQLGTAVGLAAVSSITASVDENSRLEIPLIEFPRRPNEITNKLWKEAYKGRAASFWFLLGILVVDAAAVLVFFKTDTLNHQQQDDMMKDERDKS